MSMNVVLIILVVLAIIAVLLFVPITLEYTFSYDGNMKSSFLLRFLFFKNELYEKRKQEPQEKEKEKKPKEKKKISQIIEEVKYYKRLFTYFKKDLSYILRYAKDNMVKIKSMNFDISFAGKDPMQTGIYTGIVNGAVYNGLSVIDNFVGVEKWSVNVTPDFNSSAFVDAKFHCILNTKLVHIIVILIKFLKIYLKYRAKKKEI